MQQVHASKAGAVITGHVQGKPGHNPRNMRPDLMKTKKKRKQEEEERERQLKLEQKRKIEEEELDHPKNDLADHQRSKPVI